MVNAILLKNLEKKGYRIIGEHSACKICTWTKKSLLNIGVCYKEKFYGIKSHRCCQMTPSLFCVNQCNFCWREMTGLTKNILLDKDKPKEIIDKCIEKQRELLNGFPGNEDIDMKKFKEAQEPMHFAISLAGEPFMYKNLDGLLKELHKRGKTSFLVSNGLFPERLKKLKEMPTQFYISLDAPNKEVYKKVDKPILKDYWKRFLGSLKIMSKLKTRKVLRITLVKGLNDLDLEGYSNLIKIAKPNWVEVKAYMFVGSSRERLSIENMPRHNEVKDFGKKLSKLIDMPIVDEKEESRVVLLGKEDRKIKFSQF